MKLSEITSSGLGATGKVADEIQSAKRWLAENIDLNDIQIDWSGFGGDGIVIDGNVSFNNADCTHDGTFPFKIARIGGHLSLGPPDSAKRFKSFETFPRDVHSMYLDSSSITSFEHVPNCNDIWVGKSNISKIEDVFPYLTRKISSIDLEHTKITSLVGFADMVSNEVKQSLDLIEFNWEKITEGGLGLLTLEKLSAMTVTGNKVWAGDPKSMPFRIIEKYLKRKDDIFDCQQELIEAGYEEYAQL